MSTMNTKPSKGQKHVQKPARQSKRFVLPATCFIAGTLAVSALIYTATAVPSNIVNTAVGVPTGEEYGQALAALGLNAESMACIDVGGNETTIVLNRLVEHYAYYEQYIALQENIAQQQRNAHQAQTTLRDFPRDTEAQTALGNAQSQVASLTSQAQTLKTALVNTLLEDLADQSAVPIVIHAQGQIGQLPPAYRLAVDTNDEATKLAWALKKQAVADEQGGSVNSEASYILNNANGQIAVQHALGRVNSYGAQNQIAIDAWMAEH